MAAILVLRSSLRLAISLSFSSLLILAILGVAAGAGGIGASGTSSGISSHPDASAAAETGTEGFDGGMGEVTGVGLDEVALAAGLPFVIGGASADGVAVGGFT